MAEGRRPTKRKTLGQHHLRDEGLCRPAVEYLARFRPAATPPTTVVEVGPGGGVLTSALLAAGHPVIALELDARWAFFLRSRDLGAAGRAISRNGGTGRTGDRAPALRLGVVDALAVDWSRLPGGAAVAGNLPYQIATALVEAMLDTVADGTIAVFLVQREVAERMAAAPGTPAYGGFSVLVQARCGVDVLARVRPGSFVPPPKVESAFVGLRFSSPPVPEAEWRGFKGAVRAAFGARRKTVRNSLAVAWGRSAAVAALDAAGLPGDARAESFALEAFLRLWHARSALGRG